MTAQAPPDTPVWQRLWQYQAERFPVFSHATTVLLFSVAIAAAAANLGGEQPSILQYLVGTGCVFLVFLVLRVLDEFKDAETDRLYRPERPVPRGLVSLRLLGGVGAAAVGISLILAAVLLPSGLLAIVFVWLWAGLMAVEFFVPKALKKRPLLYLVSHMLIMPGLVFFLARSVQVSPSPAQIVALLPLFVLAFSNGSVLEIGRKLWAVENERPGVETYSSLFGVGRGTALWFLTAATSGVAVLWILAAMNQLELGIGGLVVVLILAGASAYRYATRPDRGGQKWINTVSGLCVLVSCSALIMAGALNGVFG